MLYPFRPLLHLPVWKKRMRFSLRVQVHNLRNNPSSEQQSQEKTEIKNNTEQKNTDTSGSGSSKGTAEKDSGNKTMADKVQSPSGDVIYASPQSTSAKVLPFQEDKKKPKKSTVVNATNNKTSNKATRNDKRFGFPKLSEDT